MNGRCPFRFCVLAIAAACAAFALPPGASAASEAEAAADVSASSSSATDRVWNRAQDLAIFALGLIGVDYRFGGNTPEAGLDCSGLVGYVFQQVTGITLPRTSQELSRMGRRVTVADLKVGDLVFFDTRSLPFSHVGIYLGDDRFVHAPSRGGEVEIVSLSAKYWHARFSGARRLAAVSTETRSQDARAAGNALPRPPSTATSLPPLMETLADTAN
jgi:cell wall-associated NlpC family hydrolase